MDLLNIVPPIDGELLAYVVDRSCLVVVSGAGVAVPTYLTVWRWVQSDTGFFVSRLKWPVEYADRAVWNEAVFLIRLALVASAIAVRFGHLDETVLPVLEWVK